jgi:hypothetical protein
MVSYAAARKRLGVGKESVEVLVRCGVLTIRFEGTPKGIALRYSVSDMQRIAAEHGTREQLRKELTRLRSELVQWEADRQMRLATERPERYERRLRLERERLEADRLEAARQRIVDAVRAAKAGGR